MSRPWSLLLALLASLAQHGFATPPVEFSYMMHCQGCHLPDGAGFPERGVPAAKDNLGKFLGVPGGRAFLVRVPGSSMSDLDNEELAEVLNWMLVTFSERELPTDFSPYTAAEVKTLRATPLLSVKEVRSKLMVAIDRLEQTKSEGL